MALLDRDPGAAVELGVDRGGGARDHERDAGGAGGERQAVGADLVGHVPVGRHAIAADHHRVDLAARDEAGGRAVGQQLVLDARAAELPHRQPAALEQRPGLVHQHPDRPAVGQLEDHGEARPAPPGGERAGVAVREHGPRTGQQVGAVGRHARAGLVLLGVDGLCLRARGRPEVGGIRGQRGVAHTVDRAPEIGRGRPGGAQASPGRLETVPRRARGDLHGQAVGGGDPDQRRAADAEAADGRGGVVRPAEHDHPLLERQQRLVEDLQPPAVPGQRRRGGSLALGQAHATKASPRPWQAAVAVG